MCMHTEVNSEYCFIIISRCELSIHMYEICALTNNHPSVSYSTHDVYVGSTV